ncbi:MAG: mannose/fructose/sorbose PTS transporter subunit IIA [Clostridium perfringens]|nr:mannose/fructose/sorbose PTS transporter subunit IIA [Clostridium perfringens]
MIAVIVATHGELADEIVKVSEMIFGKQENVGVVTFLREENIEALKRKYDEQLSALNKDNGVLFLVDIFGGSPFKIASSISLQNDNMDIITGVNLPMLLEIYKLRDYLGLKEIVKFTKDSAKDGIKSLKSNTL